MKEEARKPRRPWGSGAEYTTARGQHVVRDRLPDGTLVRGTSMRSMAEARAKVRRKLRDGTSSSTTSPTSSTVAEYLARWFDETAIHRLAPRTMALYRFLARRWIVPKVGAIELLDLRPGDVEAVMLSVIAAGGAPQTARHTHTVMRSALRDAERRGQVPVNVAARVQPVKVPRRPILRLTAAQVRGFLAANATHDHYAIWVLAFTTGMRRGEILSLRWADVDERLGTVTVAGTLYPVKPEARLGRKRGRRTQWRFLEPKTPASARRLWLSQLALDALAAHKRERPPVRPPFFVFRTSRGMPLDADAVARSFDRALKAAGLPDIRFHDTRHTAIAMMLDDSQGDLRLAQQAAGHGSITTTVDRYGGIAVRAMKRAAAAMDEALGEPVKGAVGTHSHAAEA